MVTLSGKVGNNGLAYVQTLTKVERSRKRNSKLLDVLNGKIIKINDKELPVLWVNIETEKLNYSFESIARGLYYHENNKSFKGKITIVSKVFNHPDDLHGTEFYIRASKMIESERMHWDSEVKGANKEVFSYQFSPIDEFKTQTLALNFFEGIDVYIILNELTEKDYKEAKFKLSFLNKVFFGDLQ